MIWRYLAGAAAMVLAVGAAALFWTSPSRPSAIPQALAQTAASGQADAGPLPATVPEASDRTREEKRFDRYDKDRDGAITREEYLMQRRKAYAKLDTNHDGALSFDEWAVKATTKFATADADKSGQMSAPEFATTAVKRKPARRAPCPPAQAARDEEG